MNHWQFSPGNHVSIPQKKNVILKNFLGPTLVKAGYGNKKIIVWDHNRDLLFERANIILNDSEAAKYAEGFHWYEDWKDGTYV
jgi:glucosylceramidase